MAPNLSIAISASTLRALLEFQSEQESEVDPAGLADLAIRDWLQRQRELAKPAGQRGYFWKLLFLPEGTRLRISSHVATRYAAIVGDDFVHDGMAMSPNQFAQMTLGSTRSAWHAIRVQLPGEREWKLALRLRYAAEAQARHCTNRPAATAATPSTTPVPASAAALAKSPSAGLAAPKAPALPAEVLYVPHLRPDAEERRRSYRRAEDLLLD